MQINQSILTQLRHVQLELLDEFVRICEKYNLIYFLTTGTLLGAVRHKGFIPWDDDLDVAMPRKDYEKFIDIINESTNHKYYVLSNKIINNKSKYCLNFTKFCKKNTEYAESYKEPESFCGIYIDIFPFDNCNIYFAPLHALLIKYSLNIYRVKLNAIYKKNNMYIIAKIFCSLFPLKIIKIIQKNIYNLFNNKKTRFLTYFTSIYGYKKETYNYNTIFPLSKIFFEGKYYNAPNNCDIYLNTIYGNYMDLPPVKDRQTHMPIYINFN